MKKLVSLLLSVVLLAGLGSCKKLEKEIDKLFTFYIQDDYTFVLPAIPFTGTIPPLSYPTSTDATSEFRKANTRADLVKEVTLDKLSLAITDPATANFDFLENVRFYISTTENPTRLLIASLSSVPLGVRTLELQPTSASLAQHLKAENYTLTVEGTLRKPVPQSTTTKMDYSFKVTADPL